MNSLPVHQKNSIKKVSRAHHLWYAAAAILALSACSPREKEKVAHTSNAAPVVSSETTKDNFCADITSDNFNAGVRAKIQTIGQEIPEVNKLLEALDTSPNSVVHFFDKNGFLSYLQSHGVSRAASERYITDAGAMTYIPDKKTPTDKEQICIYLSPHALASKDNFIQGVVNELLNAIMAIQLPDQLESKRRLPDVSGGLNISEKEMRGIGIEFSKEYISGLVSTLIIQRYKKKDISCSVSLLRKNLEKWIFWHTDEPNYACDYFYHILFSHGFPVEKNPELLKLYTFCLNTHWNNISKNTLRICQWLDIPVQQ